MSPPHAHTAQAQLSQFQGQTRRPAAHAHISQHMNLGTSAGSARPKVGVPEPIRISAQLASGCIYLLQHVAMAGLPVGICSCWHK